MPLDREFWQRPLAPSTRWPCPSCGVGHLRLKKDSLKHMETAASKEAKKDPDWEPDWMKLRFSALMVCDEATCCEAVAVIGDGGVEYNWSSDRNDDEPYVDRFYPSAVSPSPDLFPLPKRCPEEIAAAVKKAFRLSWGEPDACANQIRIVLEALLTDLKISKQYRKRDGTYARLSLHSRIERFGKRNSTTAKQLAEYMKAAKWLGNAGSHDAEPAESLSRSDLFDAFDLLQYVLDEIYDQKSSTLQRLAKTINRKKGPRRPK